MKTVVCSLLLLSFVLACQNADQTSTPVDKAAIEKEVGALMDGIYEAQKPGNFDDMSRIIADGGIIMGTDPGEVFDKVQMIKTYKEYSKDPVLAEYLASMDFDVVDRKVKISDDGTWAHVVDRTNVSFSELDIRGVAVMQKLNNEWHATFVSYAFLINNADLAKIDSLMKQ